MYRSVRLAQSKKEKAQGGKYDNSDVEIVVKKDVDQKERSNGRVEGGDWTHFLFRSKRLDVLNSVVVVVLGDGSTAVSSLLFLEFDAKEVAVLHLSPTVS